jgi:putative transposase
MRQPTVTERFPTRRRIRLPRGAYGEGHCVFVTISAHDKYPWFATYLDLADQVAEVLERLADERQTALHAWCLMPDHLHLLTQDADIGEFVRLAKGRATPLARRYESGRRLWQRSFYDHILRKGESVGQVAQYIFENPVRSGLVENPSEYRWSGSSVWPHWRTFY